MKHNILYKILRTSRKYSKLIFLIVMSILFISIGFKQISEFGFFYTDLASISVMTALLFSFYQNIHNEYSKCGILFFQVIKKSNKYYLEISNVGSLPIHEVQLNITVKTLDTGNVVQTDIFTKFSACKFSIKQGDIRLILLDDSIGNTDVISVVGDYMTMGNIYEFKRDVSISDVNIWDN